MPFNFSAPPWAWIALSTMVWASSPAKASAPDARTKPRANNPINNLCINVLRLFQCNDDCFPESRALPQNHDSGYAAYSAINGKDLFGRLDDRFERNRDVSAIGGFANPVGWIGWLCQLLPHRRDNPRHEAFLLPANYFEEIGSRGRVVGFEQFNGECFTHETIFVPR